MNKPLVSIITPTYNHEAYIGACIESVLAQSYVNWEQIIVDDCSTDNTMDIVSSYNDPRIKLLRNDSHGGPTRLHASYNSALEMAKGELIAVLEGDDFWPKQKLEIQVKAHKNKFVLSWGLCVKLINNKFVSPSRKSYPRTQKEYPNINELLLGNMIPSVTVIIHKSYLSTIGGFRQPKGALFADYLTWLLLRKKGPFIFIPEILGVYRIHKQQISKTNKLAMVESSIKCIDYVLASMDELELKNIKLRQVKAAQYLLKALSLELRSDVIRAKKIISMLLC